MIDEEGDSPLPPEQLSPLEVEVLAAIQRGGILAPEEQDFVVRRIRTTIRTVELGRLIGRPLSRKERGQVCRRLQDGQSLEQVLDWLRKKPARPLA